MRDVSATIVISAFAASLSCATAALAAPSAAEILDGYKTATGGSAWDSKVTLSIEAAFSGLGMTGTVHSLTDVKDGRSFEEDKVGPTNTANGFAHKAGIHLDALMKFGPRKYELLPPGLIGNRRSLVIGTLLSGKTRLLDVEKFQEKYG